MANSVFDDLFENKKLFEKRELFQQYEKSVKKTIEENKTDTNDLDIEQLLIKARENPEKLLNEEEVDLLLRRKDENIKKGNETLARVINLKNQLKKEVELVGGYNLDISKKQSLINHANAVFGNNKTQITFDDYVTLLEMRKLLELKDSEELFTREFE